MKNRYLIGMVLCVLLGGCIQTNGLSEAGYHGLLTHERVKSHKDPLQEKPMDYPTYKNEYSK